MILEAKVKNTLDCKENKINVEVMEEAGLTRSLVNRIRKQQATFVGHTLRRKGLEHLVITGKMEGRRGRGRQREHMIDSLAAWMDIDKTASAISAATDRAVWKDMFAKAFKAGHLRVRRRYMYIQSNLPTTVNKDHRQNRPLGADGR